MRSTGRFCDGLESKPAPLQKRTTQRAPYPAKNVRFRYWLVCYNFSHENTYRTLTDVHYFDSAAAGLGPAELGHMWRRWWRRDGRNELRLGTRGAGLSRAVAFG